MIVGVYGSLRKGLGNHALIKRHGSQMIGDGYLKIPHTMYSLGGYPCICKSDSPKTNKSFIELYPVVSDEMLKDLDRLEGNGSFYTREEVVLDDGTVAWVYFIPEDRVDTRRLEVVESGDWVEFQKQRGYYR